MRAHYMYTGGGPTVYYFPSLISYTRGGFEISCFTVRITHTTRWTWNIFPLLIICTQGGLWTSYVPVIIPYTTGWTWNSLLPHITRWTWNSLLPSAHSPHCRVELKHVTSQCSFPTLQGGPGTSYFPVFTPHTIG